MRTKPYCLQAAFFHRGNPGSGHYYIYIKDFKKEIWRKYNDDKVEDISNTDEIFKDPSLDPSNKWHDTPPTPYFLVYVREDLKDDLVESVKREIIEPAPGQNGAQMIDWAPEDTPMTNGTNGTYSESRTQTRTKALTDMEQVMLSSLAEAEHGWDNSEAPLTNGSWY